MNSMERWMDRCSARLLEIWPVLAGADSDALAGDLWEHERWRAMAPEAAAMAWSAECRCE
jgi:hypothetical protein